MTLVWDWGLGTKENRIGLMECVSAEDTDIGTEDGNGNGFWWCTGGTCYTNGRDVGGGRTLVLLCVPKKDLLHPHKMVVTVLSVWGQEINISFVFIVCSFQLAWLEDMAKRRTLLKDEHLSPKIE